MKKFTAFFAHLIAILERFSDRPWYFPVACFIAAIDLFVMFIPTEGLLVSSVILQPKKWIQAFMWISVGSALGSTGLGFASAYYGEAVVHFFVKDALSSPVWVKAQHFLDLHGPLSVGLIAFSPIPLQPAVVLAGLAHMPLFYIFLSVWIARGVKFGLYAWVTTHAPHLLKRLRRGMKELEKIEAEKK